MSPRLRALPGGATVSGTTTEATVDLRAFIGYDVLIFAVSQDVLFSACGSAGGALVTTGGTAASLTALVADRAPAGFGKVREVSADAPYLSVKVAASTDVIFIKPISRKSNEN